MNLDPEQLKKLSEHAEGADDTLGWPAESWAALKALDAHRWTIPIEFGGLGVARVPFLEGYRDLAGACMTSVFLLSQRDAAVRRLLESENESLKQEIVPVLASGAAFATVGIAQITTSRQHTRPAMRAEISADKIQLDGVLPWVSGATNADYIVAGAVLDDGQQILAALPTNKQGVQVESPAPLMALRGSCTALVKCDKVVLDKKLLIAGPAEKVVGGDATGGLSTSALALGLAAAAIKYTEEESEKRPEYVDTAHALRENQSNLWAELVRSADGPSDIQAAGEFRGQANICVLKATQAALTISKGTGFVRPHPAQRWARQAMFFLVWSCPRPAAEAALGWFC